MPQKSVVIIAAFFVATVVSAVAGYAVYHGYSATLRLLEGSPDLYALLSRVTYLKFNATSPNDGSFIVEFENNPDNGSGVLRYFNANGTLLAVYEFTYRGGVIITANMTNATTGETRGVPSNEMERILLSPFELTTKQEAGTVTVTGVKPTPGLAPLTLPYVAAEELQIDWRRGTSPIARVRVAFTDYEFNGETYKGVSALVEPQAQLPTSTWTQLAAISMIIIHFDGLAVVAEASVVAGQDTLTINLIDIKTG